MVNNFDWDTHDQKVVHLTTLSYDPSIDDWKNGLGTGSIIYSYRGHTLILTCGHNVIVSFSRATKFTVKFADGSSCEGDVLSDQLDAEREIAILHTFCGVDRPVVDFSDALTSGAPIGPLMMSSHSFGWPRVSRTIGHLSCRSIPGDMVCRPEIPEFVEYCIPAATGSSGAGVVDPEGRLIAVHFGVVEAACRVDVPPNDLGFVSGYNFMYSGNHYQGIPVTSVLGVLEKMCRSLGLEWSSVDYKERLKDFVNVKYSLPSSIPPSPSQHWNPSPALVSSPPPSTALAPYPSEEWSPSTALLSPYWDQLYQ